MPTTKEIEAFEQKLRDARMLEADHAIVRLISMLKTVTAALQIIVDSEDNK